MAEWRITPQNPIRNPPHLDYERCAALHNLIITRGWQESGRSLPDLDCQTWWDLHASEAPSILGPDVVEFLKTAQDGHSVDAQNHTFHRYLAGLCRPELMPYGNAMYAQGEDDSNKQRYITLYQENPYLDATHPLGLVYDQVTHCAIHAESLHASNSVADGLQEWLPLEVILEAYLQMMDRGKVKAVHVDYKPMDGDQEIAHPWIMPSYTEQDLNEAIAEWNSLVVEIESRMGLQDQSDVATGLSQMRLEDKTITPGLFPNLDHLPPQSFANRFIKEARKPRFTLLAPGLRIATQQPFAQAQLVEEGMNNLRPTLLLENDLPAHRDFYRSGHGHVLRIYNFDRDVENAVTGALPQVSSLPAGLYLTESSSHSMHPWEDGVKLLLPFTLGSQKSARLSDSSLIGELSQPRSSELYQSGFNPYIKAHDVQLRYVLKRWREMVRDGKWEVGEDGVKGGIEKWREADEETNWRDYVLPKTW